METIELAARTKRKLGKCSQEGEPWEREELEAMNIAAASEKQNAAKRRRRIRALRRRSFCSETVDWNGIWRWWTTAGDRRSPLRRGDGIVGGVEGKKSCESEKLMVAGLGRKKKRESISKEGFLIWFKGSLLESRDKREM
ncbi:hypothetical protein MA16_Dca009818 [Dendrobium catenatum]|uniref:Uncharacterized protein n=1 Tax=Dendrobium catenatum TaxID=906689 RepID=A0A2I0XIA0_9ASPA|nr:hypothetical protein MA16_Dca009818 [Dendrobium catenatum]